MHRKFGKKDVIFIGALLGICLIVLGIWYFAGGKQGASVVVTREGEVHQKAISAENESIVCLPNRVVVTVTNSKKEGMDGFAQ